MVDFFPDRCYGASESRGVWTRALLNLRAFLSVRNPDPDPHRPGSFFARPNRKGHSMKRDPQTTWVVSQKIKGVWVPRWHFTKRFIAKAFIASRPDPEGFKFDRVTRGPTS